VGIVAPSDHPTMQEVHHGLCIYEKRLRGRCQECFDSLRNYSTVLSKVRWTPEEETQLQLLLKYAHSFNEAYADTLLRNQFTVHALRNYTIEMTKKFRGVFQACVCDVLSREEGYYTVIGLACALENGDVVVKATSCDDEKATRLAMAALTSKDHIKLYTAAVITQEILTSYIKEVADDSEGMPLACGAKHLSRIIEKQQYTKTLEMQGVQIWDGSRGMVQYDTMLAMSKGLKRLQRDHVERKIRILRIKERFSKPSEGGWSDILINICFLPTHHGLVSEVMLVPFEIQMVHFQMMLIRQDMGAHKAYKEFRTASEILQLEDFLEAQSRVPPISVQSSTLRGSAQAVHPNDAPNIQDTGLQDGFRLRQGSGTKERATSKESTKFSDGLLSSMSSF